MAKKKATAAQLRNLAKGRKKLAAMRRRGKVTRKKSVARPRRRARRRNPDVSPEAWELILFGENSRDHWIRNQYTSILKNIARKINSGIYEPAKAPKLWEYWFNSVAKQYNKEHGSGRGYGIFTPTIRREAAAYYAPIEGAAVGGGEYESITGPVFPGSKKKKKRRAKKKAKTSAEMFTLPKQRNPARGNFMTARNVLKTGRTTNPVRSLQGMYFVCRGSRYFTGYSFSGQKTLAVRYVSLGAAKAAAQKLADKTGSNIRIVDARK